MGGAAAGVGTIAATYLTGAVADRYSFAPILIGASLVPLIAVVALLSLSAITAKNVLCAGSSEAGNREIGRRRRAEEF